MTFKTTSDINAEQAESLWFDTFTRPSANHPVQTFSLAQAQGWVLAEREARAALDASAASMGVSA